MKKQMMKKYTNQSKSQQLAETALSVVMAKWANNEIVAERNALVKRVEELKKMEMTNEQKRQVCEESPYLHVTAKTVWCKLPAELKKAMNWCLNDDGDIVGWYWSVRSRLVPAPRTDTLEATADEMVANAIRAEQACIDELVLDENEFIL